MRNWSPFTYTYTYNLDPYEFLFSLYIIRGGSAYIDLLTAIILIYIPSDINACMNTGGFE